MRLGIFCVWSFFACFVWYIVICRRQYDILRKRISMMITSTGNAASLKMGVVGACAITDARNLGLASTSDPNPMGCSLYRCATHRNIYTISIETGSKVSKEPEAAVIWVSASVLHTIPKKVPAREASDPYRPSLLCIVLCVESLEGSGSARRLSADQRCASPSLPRPAYPRELPSR